MPTLIGAFMPKGYLLLVLHAHLPYVRHPEYDRFLEERWYFEAVTETYIPLIKFCDRLRSEGKSFKLTLSISPPLANMMEDPLLRERYVRHLDLSISLAERECERTRDWPEMSFLAHMYKRLFSEAKQTFVERCGTRLVQAFKQFEEAGNLELITCAGTHGFLPLLNSEPSTVRAQVMTAVHEHERIFGRRPKGSVEFPGMLAFTRAWTNSSPKRASAISSSIRTESNGPTPSRCSASALHCSVPQEWRRLAGIP